MSDWQEWKGGECPVAPDTLVGLFLTDEDTGESWETSPSAAKSIVWEHPCKYRVISEPKTTAIPTPNGLKSLDYTGEFDELINKDREELRIRAALAALPTISQIMNGWKPNEVAERSFDIADAFIEELERRKSDDK